MKQGKNYGCRADKDTDGLAIKLKKVCPTSVLEARLSLPLSPVTSSLAQNSQICETLSGCMLP